MCGKKVERRRKRGGRGIGAESLARCVGGNARHNSLLRDNGRSGINSAEFNYETPWGGTGRRLVARTRCWLHGILEYPGKGTAPVPSRAEIEYELISLAIQLVPIPSLSLSFFFLFSPPPFRLPPLHFRSPRTNLFLPADRVFVDPRLPKPTRRFLLSIPT